MNNNIWIWVVVALVVIAGIWYFMMGSSSTTTPTTGTETSTDTTGTVPSTDTNGTALSAPIGTGTGKITSLVGRQGNYTCTFFTLDGNNKSTGTLYVTSGKSRADYRTDAGATGKTTTAHVIRTGGIVYTWVDGMTSGYKTTDPNGVAIPKNSNSVGYFATDKDTNLSWDCHAWLPDMTQFAIPQALSFIDTTAE